MMVHPDSRAPCLAFLGVGILLWCVPAAAETAVACPSRPMRVVRSAGGVIDYLGMVPGVPELCRIQRDNGEGDYYFGVWRSDWPGAGQAYPALRQAVLGPKGTRTSFVTRSFPGLQWLDTFVNQGLESIVVNGEAFQALRVAHEREGIEGNTYHSIITSWRDVATGVSLRVAEDQISGQFYGPDTTWTAVQVGPLR